MVVPKHKLEKPSLSQVRKLANQLTLEEQQALYYTLGSKVRHVTIEGSMPALYATDVKPIWEQIEEMTDALPEDAFDSVPVDGASNHDKYLYGSAK